MNNSNPLIRLPSNILFLIASFLEDAFSYLAFSRRTCEDLVQKFKADERHLVFVSLYISRLLEDSDYISQAQFGKAFTEHYKEKFVEKMGFPLSVFYLYISNSKFQDLFHPNNKGLHSFLEMDESKTQIRIRQKVDDVYLHLRLKPKLELNVVDESVSEFESTPGQFCCFNSGPSKSI